MSRIDQAQPLFDLIIAHEASPSAQRAQGVDNPFDVVWGRIKAKDRPQSPISKLTVRRVLWWQDAIDPIYMSEAAGFAQFMEDTLRPLAADMLDELFDEKTQKALCLRLLDRRGWAKCEAGLITPTQFADELAKEWASLPVMTGKKRGRSYYAGDGLNKAGATPEEVLRAIHAALDRAPTVTAVEIVPPVLTAAEMDFMHDLIAWANLAPPPDDLPALVDWRNAMPKGAS